MRLSVPLAWVLLIATYFTAGLLRQFHAGTPTSPLASPVVGSLLFAAIFVLLLVSAREWRLGAVAGRGVRLGSLTPLMLMLLIEKWVSITLYPPLFLALADPDVPESLLDAGFRAFAGFGLLLVCLLVARLSRPAMRKTWRRARPSRWPLAALGTLLVVGSSYALLGLLGAALGGGLHLRLPAPSVLLPWVLGSQALLAFAEEVYYRGLLLAETSRLAPRLGASGPAARRWIALGATSILFGMEHLTLGPPWPDALREIVFTVSLGMLLGILVMVSANLHFVAGMHAWINWLLLGAAPHFVDAGGRPALASGTYIGLALVMAFLLAFAWQSWRRRAPRLRPEDREPMLQM
jgi:membrane protease YdiL (CAAX protease family)